MRRADRCRQPVAHRIRTADPRQPERVREPQLRGRPEPGEAFEHPRHLERLQLGPQRRRASGVAADRALDLHQHRQPAAVQRPSVVAAARRLELADRGASRLRGNLDDRGPGERCALDERRRDSRRHLAEVGAAAREHRVENVSEAITHPRLDRMVAKDGVH